MKIQTLLEGLDYEIQTGNILDEVSEVVYDSRKVSKGCLFVCIAGTARDAHKFIPEVLEKGASALIIDSGHIASALSLIHI